MSKFNIRNLYATMPILVKDYTWIQSSKSIQIRIPIKAGYKNKIDLFSSDCYIKVNFHPFLFELFLMHDVDITKSKCILDDNFVLVELVKNEEIMWTELEKPLNKEEKMKLRQNIITECQERAKLESEDRAIKKSNLDRITVQQAMNIDNKQHVIMDERRDEERKKAMDELEMWRKFTDEEEIQDTITRNQIEKSTVKIIELPPDYTGDSQNIQIPRKENNNKTTAKKTRVKSEYVDKKREETAKRILPKLRETAQVEITHTPRSFPTPSRESTSREEETWLKNITLARRATGKLI